jgi:PAS domain S-box-containing protein
LVKFVINISRAQQQTEQNASNQLKTHLSRYVSVIQHFVYAGDTTAVARSLRLLEGDTTLVAALILDENNTIIAAFKAENMLNHLGSKGPQLFNEVRRSQSCIILPEGDILNAAFPVLLESYDHSGHYDRPGVICFRYIISGEKSAALQTARLNLLTDLVITLCQALFIWLLIDLIFSRRISRLVRLSRYYASGDLSRRSDFPGRDEVSLIGQALNEMAAHLSEDHKRVKESERKYIKLSRGLERIILKRTKAFEEANHQLTVENQRAMSAEQELRKFSRAVEQSPVAILITDPTGIIEYINPRFCELTGYEPPEVLGKTPRILKSGQMPKIIYDQLWSTISSGFVWRNEIQNRKKNNDLYWANIAIAPVKNEAGEVTNYISIQEDITERKQSGETIKMLAQAIQSVSEIVYITDLERRIIFVNDAFLKAHGYEQEEVIGSSVSIIHPGMIPEEIAEQLKNATIKGGWQGEVITKRKDGSEIPVLLATSVILDEAGKAMALIGVAMDITQQKEIEASNKKSEMLKTVQELAGAVSHEFSQPLQALSNYLALLKTHPEKKQYINRSEEMVKRIAMLVNNLREITNIRKQDYLSTQIIDIKASACELVSGQPPAILIVDDEQSILETMVEILQTAGYTCDGANDGFEALQLLHRKAYRLVLSDISMPRMNGGDLFNKARAIGYKGYFLFMTGYAVTKELEQIIRESDGLINKPVDYQNLLQIVAKFMQSSAEPLEK